MRTLGAAICMVAAAGAFVLPGGMRMSAQPRKAAVTRRDALLAGGLAIAGAVSTAAAPAHAASTIPGGDRLLNGYKQLTYLLDNWDKETTSCDANGKCDRKPDNVRRYLGLRSTTDPLFQIERVLDKAQAYIDDPDDSDKYIEAAETFQSTQSMANSMAFTSSFGEYNPGGGKDQVDKYLEESRKQVVLCQQALGDIVQILKLQ
eukprot:TRINITY_DN2486_c0_g1_i1.p1 TRINITY_DN2486_c0_g1~~TRINITY_DN2486_c0_g1_i1.p1  ORF type:complete len:204 (+),score=68.62 TRINITY_DN2486_c0_g1_i1:48-659(+)